MNSAFFQSFIIWDHSPSKNSNCPRTKTGLCFFFQIKSEMCIRARSTKFSTYFNSVLKVSGHFDISFSMPLWHCSNKCYRFSSLLDDFLNFNSAELIEGFHQAPGIRAYYFKKYLTLNVLLLHVFQIEIQFLLKNFILTKCFLLQVLVLQNNLTELLMGFKKFGNCGLKSIALKTPPRKFRKMKFPCSPIERFFKIFIKVLVLLSGGKGNFGSNAIAFKIPPRM